MVSINSSLIFTQRPGHQAYNCKIGYFWYMGYFWFNLMVYNEIFYIRFVFTERELEYFKKYAYPSEDEPYEFDKWSRWCTSSCKLRSQQMCLVVNFYLMPGA